MRKIRCNLKKRSYDIIIGKDILKDLGRILSGLAIGSDAYVITNSEIKAKYGVALQNALKGSPFSVHFKTIPDSEKSKSIAVLSAVVNDIARFDKKKKIFIIAFGGGVIGDLSGFVASVYKRGIPYVQIPTTLLAQVDSSIGGKTAVDLSQGKNLMGAFYQPRCVLSDISLLKSLSARQMRAGLAEVVKYACIRDTQLFAFLEKNYKAVLACEQNALEYVVSCCSSIKAQVVSVDEREEKGVRTILNFGHTIGHAIEAAGGYKGYNHGEAVAIGMVAVSEISLRLGLIDAKTSQRIATLIRAIGLPTDIRRVSLGKIVAAHYRDKKFIGLKNRFVLLKGIGRTTIVENIPLELIKSVLNDLSV